MNKSRIEWCDYTINPVKGLCPWACPYCYARRLYKRFRWNPEIRYDPIKDIDLPKKPSRVFVGSTMELFGEWVDAFWLDSIFGSVKDNPQHTFIFLTKQPQNLIKWSPFPDNCQVGVTATDNEMAFNASCNLILVKAKVKFISFEPLLGRIGPAVLGLLTKQINWLIIGQQTPVKNATMPKIEWIQEILVACSNAGNIPVFMKNNLEQLLVGQWAGWKLRQEFPK